MPLGGRMCRLLTRRSRYMSERRVLTRRFDVLGQGVLRGFAFYRCIAAFAARSCAAGACWRSLVAASGGQGGIGGLRFPAPHCAHSRPVFRAAARQPHSSRAARDLRGPSLDSPLPLETPPLRYGVGGGGALRSYAALCRCCKGFVWCFLFLRRFFHSRRALRRGRCAFWCGFGALELAFGLVSRAKAGMRRRPALRYTDSQGGPLCTYPQPRCSRITPARSPAPSGGTRWRSARTLCPWAA